MPLSDEAFRPTGLLRNAHLQSILPSVPPRRWFTARRADALLRSASTEIVDCDGLAQLKYSISRATAPTPTGRRMALLLHGWEGSSDSSYVLSLGALLLGQGYNVLRLNLRDHGGTQALNRELFHSCRLPEVQAAVAALARQHADARLYLAGFSLGGNFLLRVAAAGVPANIAGVVAVSPVLDPEQTLRAMERGTPIYQSYFIRKWVRSLRLKQQHWPQDYQFDHLLRGQNLRSMTRELVSQHTEYSDIDSYLAGYAITGARLASLGIPARILISNDDPIIPVADLARLASPVELQIHCESYGGHCGFIERMDGASYADQFVARQFASF